MESAKPKFIDSVFLAALDAYSHYEFEKVDASIRYLMWEPNSAQRRAEAKRHSEAVEKSKEDRTRAVRENNSYPRVLSRGGIRVDAMPSKESAEVHTNAATPWDTAPK
jgi:hypothetical protein